MKIHRGPLFWFAITFTILSVLHFYKFVTHSESHDIIKSIANLFVAVIFLELHMRSTWDGKVITLSSSETLERFLLIIPEPNRTACMELFSQARVRFHRAPGSTHNHQAWEGGYLDHIVETMTIAEILFKPLNAKRKLPFTLGDVILCLFLHDIEKPWKYVLGENELEDADLSTKEKRHEFRREIISKYGFKLTDEHWNGIEFAEGEIHQYSNTERHMGRLAAFVHMCDVWSARGWYDEPLNERAKL